MYIKNWFKKRGFLFILERAKRLCTRYNFNPRKSIDRIEQLMDVIREYGCYPTFVVPGVVVERNRQLIHHIQEYGAEIAIHGYNHVDLRSYPLDEGKRQLQHALEVFQANQLEPHGFRCPYLSYYDELLNALPQGLFEYSSNQAIYWDVTNGIRNSHANLVVDTLHDLYQARSSDDDVSIPRNRLNLVEIPVSIPDDLELLDGLKLSPKEVASVWSQILIQTHQRGELFTLIFHPEVSSLCAQPFSEILKLAKEMRPKIWIARLCDISQWWSEKERFNVEASETSKGLRINFTCSPRATILVKGLDIGDTGILWDEGYQSIHTITLEVPASPRPFLGISPHAPLKVISFLRDQGYLVDMSEAAANCGIYLDENKLSQLGNEKQLIQAIEASPGPLIRYWRWPDGAKSALSITGDLDALSLLDYIDRFFA